MNRIAQCLNRMFVTIQIAIESNRDLISPITGLYAFYNPTPCRMKLTFIYIFYFGLYSGVVLFSLIFRVMVMVRVRVSYRVRVRDR